MTWWRPVTARCGLCDEPILPGEPCRDVDDERCHRDCANRDKAGLPFLHADDADYPDLVSENA